MELLIIEDEQAFASVLENYLEQQGHRVTICNTLQSGVNQVSINTFNCIIIDIGLPDGNGLHLIHQIKAKRNAAGVIIISARNTLDDKITGFDLGADDYLTKPFDLPELNVRIKSILRRQKQQENIALTFGQLVLDPLTRQVTASQEILSLTQKEYELLFFFITNPYQLLDKLTITRHIWGQNMDLAGNDFLYTHIRNLRKKIMDANCPDYIKTRYRVGYILTDV